MIYIYIYIYSEHYTYICKTKNIWNLCCCRSGNLCDYRCNKIKDKKAKLAQVLLLFINLHSYRGISLMVRRKALR